MKRPSDTATVETKLIYMQKHGQSVLVNWGEDDNLWECSWITGGERHSGYSRYLDTAVQQALELGIKR
jgi:hypothetical protein